ncbi:MAG TPA: hypothetical protein VL944_01775 [Candidatus Acidoferrum sp.]|nr:hypothetical protein [Candidatus Acidoferrum sp.]
MQAKPAGHSVADEIVEDIRERRAVRGGSVVEPESLSAPMETDVGLRTMYARAAANPGESVVLLPAEKGGDGLQGLVNPTKSPVGLRGLSEEGNGTSIASQRAIPKQK